MHYSKIYEQIVERARHRILNEYGEKHHIIPRCLGGTDDAGNVVKLTFREHFICHWLLCKIHSNNSKLHHAFSSMIRVSVKNKERYQVLTSRHFEIVKKRMAPFVGKWNKGKTAWNKGMTGEQHLKHYKDGKIKIPNMTGYKWINDGEKQTKIPPGTEIPEGWKRGRLDLSGDNNPMRKKK